MGLSGGLQAAKFGYAVAAKVLDVARDEGDSAIGLLQAATKAAEAGNKAMTDGLEGALRALDVYA